MTRNGRILLAVAGAGLALLAALVFLLFQKEEDAKRRRAAATYETTAAQHLKDIAALQQYHYEQTREYATFGQLVDEGLLIKEFAAEAPVVDNYVYRLTLRPRTADGPAFYAINADPQTPPDGHPGRLHFYIDSDVGNIRQNAARPATAADRPRE